MGTTISTLASRIACKQAYQEKKKLENLQRIARYLSAEEREVLFSGNGFVRVPKEEAERMKIDACLNTKISTKMSLSYYPYRFVKKIDEPWGWTSRLFTL